MRKIISIEEIESWVKGGKLHHRTRAIVQKLGDPLDTEEVSGYGNNYDIGEMVEVWYDDQWGQAKMQKRK